MKQSCQLLLLLAFLFLGSEASSAETALKSVDVNVILEKSRPARDAAAHLEKVRAALQQGYDALAAGRQGKPDKARQEELAGALNLLQRQMNIETEAARQIVLGALERVCAQWGGEHPTVWLVPRGNVLAAPATADATPEILKLMENEKVSFPDLPRVTIRDEGGKAAVTSPADASGTTRKGSPGATDRTPNEAVPPAGVGRENAKP